MYYTSNISNVKYFLIKKLIKNINYENIIKNIKTNCEIDKEFEYVRYGSVWQDFLDNLDIIKKLNLDDTGRKVYERIPDNIKNKLIACSLS